MHSVCIELVYIATCTLVILDNLFVIFVFYFISFNMGKRFTQTEIGKVVYDR